MAVYALGSISIAADGSVTKSGECEVVWDLLEADAVAAAAEFSAVLPTGPESVKRKKAQARQATTLATYVRTILTSRAQAEITTGASGLQRMPASTAEDTDTKAPGASKFLSII